MHAYMLRARVCAATQLRCVSKKTLVDVRRCTSTFVDCEHAPAGSRQTRYENCCNSSTMWILRRVDIFNALSHVLLYALLLSVDYQDLVVSSGPAAWQPDVRLCTSSYLDVRQILSTRRRTPTYFRRSTACGQRHWEKTKLWTHVYQDNSDFDDSMRILIVVTWIFILDTLRLFCFAFDQWAGVWRTWDFYVTPQTIRKNTNYWRILSFQFSLATKRCMVLKIHEANHKNDNWIELRSSSKCKSRTRDAKGCQANGDLRYLLRSSTTSTEVRRASTYVGVRWCTVDHWRTSTNVLD